MVNIADAHLHGRRKGWIRFIIYLLSFLLLVHLFNTFSKQSHSTTTSLSLTKNLPWYTSHHPSLKSLQENNKHIKTYLTTKEREELTLEMVNLAKEKAVKEFSGIKGIVGSTYYNTEKKANEFRERVSCLTTGQWVQVESPGYMMPHFQDPIYGSCERKHKKKNLDGSLPPAVKYVWQSQCGESQVDINSERWCGALNGRSLLLVGDLVQYQLHEVFLDTLRDGPAVCFGELNCKDHTICSEPESRLRYLRNDVLSTRRKMDQNNGKPKADIIEWPFTSSTLLKLYDVIMLNRAPVIESDEEFIVELISTLKAIRRQNPKMLIIYRSTGIGHPFCDDATGPLQQRLSDEELKELPFGWSEVNRRNAIAKEIVEAAGGLYIDLAALTDVRPDGHIGGQDCLRYCIPGPLTGWAQVLYQIFLDLY